MPDVMKQHYDLGPALDESMKKKIISETFQRRVGYMPDLENPKSFNEKIQWLKLYYQNPMITRCADKYAVKDYIAEIAGSEFFVPTIGVWDDPDQIDFGSLPEHFVLKVNWSSDYNIIVRDKRSLDIEAAREQLKSWMEPCHNSYYALFNWGFKHMKPVVYAEQYLEQIDNQVYDYKFYICNGKFEYLTIVMDRAEKGKTSFTWFDRDFRPCPFSRGGAVPDSLPEKPVHYEEMITIAEKLAQPFPFVRVDFYEIGDRIYVGEMTFYSGSGTVPFTPAAWDYTVGGKIRLPEKMITDREAPLPVLRRDLKTASRRSKALLKKARRAVIHKASWQKEKYLVLLGLRFPYQTHTEKGTDCSRKYIRIGGIEFCYKKLPLKPEPVNFGLNWEYKLNPARETYLMEEKITPEMQLVHCEQKAYRYLGYFPDLKNPKTLNEKVIWLALYYKNPMIAPIVDKATAKDWIASQIGEQYVVPLIGVYDRVSEIDFSALPRQFVAKLNDGWSTNRVMIIRDKTKLNTDKAKVVLSSWLYPWNNYYYKNLCITDTKMKKPLLVIEEYIGDDSNCLLQDYKFFCCNGEPRFAYVTEFPTGRPDGETMTYVDMDWNILPLSREKKPAAKTLPPQRKDEMIALCRVLSRHFPFVRVDFYEINGRVYVGELTFTPSMFGKISPRIWDSRLGEYLDLSELMNAESASL